MARGAARSKLGAGRRTRLSIVPRARHVPRTASAAPARLPASSATTSTQFVWPTSRSRPYRHSTSRHAQNNIQSKPTIFEPVIVYKRPAFNGHKLLARNIAALLVCENVSSVLFITKMEPSRKKQYKKNIGIDGYYR